MFAVKEIARAHDSIMSSRNPRQSRDTNGLAFDRG